ncbi:MAG: anti-sigma factor [Ktedonobacteraceae bacterium]|nr:anti-sigma factor [Ktedonobacteraceae bacterium]
MSINQRQFTPYTQEAAAPPASPPHRRRLYFAIAAILIVAIIGSGLAIVLLSPRTPAPATTQRPIVGHAFFVSSGQLSLFSDRGIADQVQINLQNIPAPQTGKSYYAWLLPDNESNSRATPIFLGQLPVKGGQVSVFYPGDTDNTDLLASYSRFLITAEDASEVPTNPSLVTCTWLYFAAFSQAYSSTVSTSTHYSLLDHLRHLLARDPSLEKVKLGGGLDTWLFRNMEKILEWAGSARDTQQSCQSTPGNPQCAAFIQRQATRILDYLDGPYIAQENVPPAIQGSHLLVDPTIAQVAMLEFSAQQNPPGYLKHIGNHLRNMVEVPNLSPAQHALALRITTATNNVQKWLNAIHADAVRIIHMSAADLVQPGTTSLLDDLFTQANYAFVGRTDPNTNQVEEGVVQIHYSVQNLATFDITACSAGNATRACV